MLDKKTIARLYAACLATAFAAFSAFIVHQFLPDLRIGAFIAIFGCCWVFCYFIGSWIDLVELSRNLPTSSRALRERKREFYSWLESQGRR